MSKKKNKKKEKRGDGSFKFIRIIRAMQYKEEEDDGDCDYDREHEAINLSGNDLANVYGDDGVEVRKWWETSTPGDVLITDDYIYLCQSRENTIGRIYLTTETKVENKTIQPK